MADDEDYGSAQELIDSSEGEEREEPGQPAQEIIEQSDEAPVKEQIVEENEILEQRRNYAETPGEKSKLTRMMNKNTAQYKDIESVPNFTGQDKRDNFLKMVAQRINTGADKSKNITKEKEYLKNRNLAVMKRLGQDDVTDSEKTKIRKDMKDNYQQYQELQQQYPSAESLMSKELDPDKYDTKKKKAQKKQRFYDNLYKQNAAERRKTALKRHKEGITKTLTDLEDVYKDRQELNKKRQKERRYYYNKKNIPKKPGDLNFLAQQIGGYMGFTRTGTHGAALLSQETTQQKNINIGLINRKNNLAWESKTLKEEIKEDMKNNKFVDPTKIQELRSLERSMSKLDKSIDIGQRRAIKLSAEKAEDDRYLYAGKAATPKRMTKQQRVQTNANRKKGANILSQIESGGMGGPTRKGRSNSADPLGLFSKKGPKKNFGKKFDRLLRGFDSIVETQSPLTPPKTDMSDVGDDSVANKQNSSKNNQFGVEDWILNI